MALPLTYSWRNLFVRASATWTTVGGIALVVLVIILLIALVAGIQHTLVSTARPNTLMVMRPGSSSEMVSVVQREQIQALRYLPGIARTAEGDPLVSPELLVQPFLHLADGRREPIVVRGVTPMGFRFHDQLHFVAGRAPRPSLGEAAVGLTTFLRFQEAAPGRSVSFGRRTWNIVGVFAANGSALESEVWVSVDDLLADANRTWYSVARVKVEEEDNQHHLIRRIAEDTRISLEATPEVQYYRTQAEGAQTLFLLAIVLGAIMGAGAIFGVMNTMYATVASRTKEIGTLRALGFSSRAVLLTFLTESLCVALLGFAAGVLLGVGTVWLINTFIQGMAFQLPPFAKAVASLQFSALGLLFAFGVAVSMGLCGGLLPALRASRLRIIAALRQS